MTVLHTQSDNFVRLYTQSTHLISIPVPSSPDSRDLSQCPTQAAVDAPDFAQDDGWDRTVWFLIDDG